MQFHLLDLGPPIESRFFAFPRAPGGGGGGGGRRGDCTGWLTRYVPRISEGWRTNEFRTNKYLSQIVFTFDFFFQSQHINYERLNLSFAVGRLLCLTFSYIYLSIYFFVPSVACLRL